MAYAGTVMKGLAAIAASVWLVLAFTVAGVGTAGAVQSTTQADSAPVDLSDPTAQPQQVDGNNSTGNTTEADSNETNETAAPPGARLAGAVGIHQAELEGEVQHRRLGHEIAGATSNGSKARVLGGETDRIRDRIHQLENRTEHLNESYENESMPDGAYHARLAKLSAEISTLERQLNTTETTARGLPAHVRQQHGIEDAELDHLRQRAHNMSGPEVAAIARQIGGPKAGHPMGGPPENVPGHGSQDGQPGMGAPGPSGPPNDSPGHQAGGPGMTTPNGSGNTSPSANESRGHFTDGPPGMDRTSGHPANRTNSSDSPE